MRKDLQLAHDLAASHYDLDHYKKILLEHEQQRIEAEEQKKAKAAAKAATPKKAAKKQSTEGDEVEDVDMADVEGDDEKADKKSKNKKRKAEGDAEVNFPRRICTHVTLTMTTRLPPVQTQSRSPRSS